MSQPFDPLYLLIFCIAVVLLFKLRNVLGTRTGNERRYDPVQRQEQQADPRRDDNVIHIPGREVRGDADSAAEAATPSSGQGYAEAGSPLAGGIEKIAAVDARLFAAVVPRRCPHRLRDDRPGLRRW